MKGTSILDSPTTDEKIFDIDTFNPFRDDLHFHQLHEINIDLVENIVGRRTHYNFRRSLRRYLRRMERRRMETEIDQIISEFEEHDKRISEFEAHDKRIAAKYDRHCRRRALPDSSRF